MADNIPINGVTLASKDLSGIQFLQNLLADYAGNDVLGLVTTNPNTQSVLGRLKAIADAVIAQSAYVDGLEGLITTLNGYVDGLEALAAAATPAGENHIGQVGGYAVNASANFSRPADTTAYASGDLVANSTTAGSVAAMALVVARKTQGSVEIRGVRLQKSSVSLTNASFRVHLFRAAPATIANGDNGALSATGAADYLGYYDVTIDQAFTDGAVGFSAANPRTVKLAAGQTIYALLEARAAYTPVSGETFTVTTDAVQG